MIVDQDILCALCRSAMWQQPCDLDLSPGISDEQWQRIYMNSARHGVLALALDGVMRLPKELQPEFNTRIKWGYNAEVIAKRYNAQKATAEKLAAIFAEKRIRTMDEGYRVITILSTTPTAPVRRHRYIPVRQIR